MAKYKFTNKAVDDLSAIWSYTFDKWSEKQADAYYIMLVENCKKVASSPQLGKNYSGVTANLLGFRAGKHIIFYRKIEENEVEITRILHEQMDLKHRITEK
jgi:toxin ParE1/3/4